MLFEGLKKNREKKTHLKQTPAHPFARHIIRFLSHCKFLVSNESLDLLYL